MATRAPGTTTPPDTTSPPPTPSKPSSRPTVDHPKTTTDTKSSEATTKSSGTTTTITTTTTTKSPEVTITSGASITATDKPTITVDSTPTGTTTTTMSTAKAPTTTNDNPATTVESPATTTATKHTKQPVRTTDPPVTTTTTNPPVTATTADPPVTTTTTTTTTKDPPVTTTTITNDPPLTTTTTTKDHPVTTTTKDPLVTTTTTTTTTTKDPPVRTTTTTTPPYTTRYVTTFSIVTVTTIVPETTVISGTGTTIYITRSTTSPTPTIIQDPTQDPPAGTHVDSSAKGGLQPWQITLIIVATLVMMGAVGAVVLVGRIKRQRWKRDTMLFSGDKPESVLGSEMGESGGGRSNRTLIVDGLQKYYHSGQDGGGGWRERLSAWRPWDSYGSYHHQQHPGGLDYNQGTGQGGGGGLWLMDESNPHYGRSAAAADVAAAMPPVSYDTSGRLDGLGGTIVGEEEPYYYGNYPYNNTQAQDRYYDQEEAAYSATAMATAPGGAAGTLHPLDYIAHPSVQRGLSSVTTAATAMTSRSRQRHLQQQPSRGNLTGQISPSFGQLERHSSEERSDYIDSHGLHRPSQDWTLSRITSAGAGVGTGTGTGAIEDRTSIRVDPDQLESHAISEHFRKAPQAILGTSPPKTPDSVGGKSPALPSSPPLPPLPPPSSTTATDTEMVEMIADGDKENNNAVSESVRTTTTLFSVESSPVFKSVSLVSEQQQQQPPQ